MNTTARPEPERKRIRWLRRGTDVKRVLQGGCHANRHRSGALVRFSRTCHVKCTRRRWQHGSGVSRRLNKPLFPIKIVLSRVPERIRDGVRVRLQCHEKNLLTRR